VAWFGGLAQRPSSRPDFVVSRIGDATGHDATLVADVGQNQMWTARYGGFTPTEQPHQLGPASELWASAFLRRWARPSADPTRETWAIVGDGGLQMTVQELMTLVQEHIPLRIALLNNHKAGMVRQWQELVYAGNYHSSHLLGPDWCKLAEALRRSRLPRRRARAGRRGDRRRPGR